MCPGLSKHDVLLPLPFLKWGAMRGNRQVKTGVGDWSVLVERVGEREVGKKLTPSFDPDQLLSLLHTRSLFPARKQVAEGKDEEKKKEGVG